MGAFWEGALGLSRGQPSSLWALSGGYIGNIKQDRAWRLVSVGPLCPVPRTLHNHPLNLKVLKRRSIDEWQFYKSTGVHHGEAVDTQYRFIPI
jgi:hypothetical protein